MKTRVNLTIDENLLAGIKSYVQSRNLSISEVVENYFKILIKPRKKESIVDHIKKRGKPKVNFDVNADLVDLYYKENATKYGF